MLAGKPLNINSGETLVNLGRGSVDQLEFSFKLEFHPAMYNKARVLIHRNGFSESKHMRKIWVGAMEFYFQSITKVSATKMPKDSASVMITEGFVASGGPAVEIDTGVLRLSFNVSRAFIYHDKNKVADSEEMQAQIKQMVEFAESVSGQFPKEIAFYCVNDDKTPQSDQAEGGSGKVVRIGPDHGFTSEVSNLNVFVALTMIHKDKRDPLRPWFARSPRMEVLNGGTVLVTGEKYPGAGNIQVSRPITDSTIPASIKFYDTRQYRVAQTYGTLDDSARAQAVANDMKEQTFQCHIISLPGNYDGCGNPSSVAIAISLQRDLVLPRKGEDCKICFSDLRRVQNEKYDVDIAEHLPGFLTNLMYSAMQAQQEAEDFVLRYDVVKDEKATGSIMAAEIRTALTAIYTTSENVGGIVNLKNLQEFAKKYQLHLKIPVVKTDEDMQKRLFQWHARVTDNPLPLLNSAFKVFVAKVPQEPWFESCGGDRRRANFCLQLPKQGEQYGDYIQRILDAATVACAIQVEPDTKTLRQEIQAHGEMQHPESTPDETPRPSELALRIYEWLPSLCSPPPFVVDHFALFPFMSSVLNKEAPQHLQRMYDDLDESKKTTFADHMKRIPCGLAAIPGTAACGKSKFAQFYTLMLLAANAKEDASTRHKVLILAPHNQALDDLEPKFRRALEKYGAPPEYVPQMERVYGIISEVGAAVGALSRTKDEGQQRPDEVDAADHFLAEFVLDEFKHYADQHSKQRGRKNFHSHSLHASVLEHVRENPASNVNIVKFQKAAMKGDELHMSLKADATRDIKELYRKKLQNADIVFATPSAARETFFRDAFKPTLVIVDENSRMRELTSIMCISSFPTAEMFMLLGDPHQLVPYVSSNPNKMTAPFDPQLNVSCLERMQRAGVAFDGLLHNHRQYGNLSKDPSRWFYDKTMRSAIKEQFPPPVSHVSKMIRENIGGSGSRVIVDITSAKEEAVAFSFKNGQHIQYILEMVQIFFRDAKFTSVDGSRPGSIAIIPMYDAQVTELEALLRDRKLVRNLFATDPDQLARRVQVSTLDGFQGGQADLVIVDYTRTERPGFTGDIHRITVAHTRSIQGEIVLLRQQSFSNTKAYMRNLMTKNLHMVYSKLQQDLSVIKTVVCQKCLHPGHEESKCAGTPRCMNCAYLGGHRTSACSLSKSLDVTEASGSGDKPACHRCQSPEHLAKDCPRKLTCRNCEKPGHMGKDCPDRPAGKPMACYRCGGEHVKAECPHPADVRCTDCGGNHVSGVGLCRSTDTRPRRPRQPARTDDNVLKKPSAADFVHTKTTAELEASGDADTFYSQETRDLVDRISGLFSGDSSGGSAPAAPAAQEDGQDDTSPEEQNSSTVDNFSNVPAGGGTWGTAMKYDDDDIKW